jgi:hypothetical protein
MRVSKAVGLKDGDDFSEFMVLDELDGDRHLVIQVGQRRPSAWLQACRACSGPAR